MPDESGDFVFENVIEEESYDPLGFDDEFEGMKESVELGEFTAPPSAEHDGGLAQARSARAAVRNDNRPAAERIESLFREMAPRGRVLMGLLEHLRTPRPADGLQAEVDRLQEHDSSVYKAAHYARMLERSGAIRKVDANGVDLDKRPESKPERVEVDGAVFLKPAEKVVVHWVATEEGLAYLDSDRPLERMRELLAAEKGYLSIYRRILTLCNAEGGQTAVALNAAVDSDPLVQNPRLYAPFFTTKLERCGALVWEGTWKTTEIGRAGLAGLDDEGSVQS